MECGQVDAPSSLIVRISSFIWAASEVEALNPRVAYLCRWHGLEMAERLDPASSGRGVFQFKAALRQRLERDDLQTLKASVHDSDAREMECFYREYKSKYDQALRAASTATGGKDDRALLTRMYQTATALFEVLNGVLSPSHSPGVDQVHELSKTHKDVLGSTREAVPGLRRRRRGGQEHVVTRRAAGKLGVGGNKPKQSQWP